MVCEFVFRAECINIWLENQLTREQANKSKGTRTQTPDSNAFVCM